MVALVMKPEDADPVGKIEDVKFLVVHSVVA